MPPRKIIYVAGLGHSGSTALDMLLSTKRKAVGLGQIATVLREDFATTKNRVCSCGSSALDCKFWGPVIRRIQTVGDNLRFGDRYRLVLDRAESLYGREIAVIDSSKQVANLAMLVELPDANLYVLHNVKDVRAFTISMLDNDLRKHNRQGIPERIFCEWYRGNRAAQKTATELLAQPPLQIMYEALCLATNAVAERVARFLGEDYIDLTADLNAGITHIISGNRLRLRDSPDAKRLVYDHRWLVRTEWLRPYVLLPMVRKYNERCLSEWGDELGWRSIR